MVEQKKRYDNITVTHLDNAEVEIAGAFPTEAVLHYRAKALAKLSADLTVPGFRKGHVPEKMVIEKVGEQAILEEAAEMALAENYSAIVTEQGLRVIGQPRASITKLAAGNPIEWKITTAVMPEVSLPDYRTLATDALAEVPDESTEATDEDVEKVILQLRENKWRIDNKTEDGSPAHGDAPKEEDLPELSLEFIRMLAPSADGFSSIDDFRSKIRENITADKVRKQHERRRGAVGEKLIAETKVPLPRIFVESELEKMLVQFKHDVAALGTPFDEYLKKINKTEEDLRKEWTEDAKKRATLQLALNEIATRENITADEADVKKQMEHILAHHKDAKEENVRIYAATLLTNEKVFQFLEKE